MGNISSASSSVLSLVQGLAKAKYSLLAEKPDDVPDVLQKLGDILRSIDGIHAKQFTSKEIKFGVQICGELIEISSRGNVLTGTRCLELLKLLVSIQSISRRAIDELLPATLSTVGGRTVQTLHQQFQDVDSSVLLLAVIMRALKSADDEPIEVTFLQRAEKAGFFPRLLAMVTQASTSRENGLICAAVLALELIFFILNKQSSDKMAPVQRRMVLDVMQHKDSLFELSRHPIRHLAYCSANVLLKLMAHESKEVCLAVQDAARAYGALLWSLHRVIQDAGVIGDRALTALAPILPENSSNNLALMHLFSVSPAAGSSTDYIDRARSGLTESVFEDVEEAAYDDTIVPNQLLLACFCVGNRQNTDIVLNSLPPAMDELCSSSLNIAQVLKNYSKAEVARESNGDPSLSPSPESSYCLDFVQRCQEHVSRDTESGSVDVVSTEGGGPLIRWRRASTTRRALLSRQQMLSDFSSKMGDDTNWMVLFRSLSLNLSHFRVEWNKDTLTCLESALADQVDLLDFRRRFRHEAWDPTCLSVSYPTVNAIPAVQGYFLQRTLEALWMRPAEARREVVRDPVGLSVALVDRLVVSDNVPDGLICMRILYLLLSSVPSVKGHIRLTVLSHLLKRGAEHRSGNSVIDCINVGDQKLQPLWLYRCGELAYYVLDQSSHEDISFFIRSGSFDFILDLLSCFAVVRSLVYWRPITTERDRPTLDRSLPSLALDSEVDGIDIISTMLRIIAKVMTTSSWFTSTISTKDDVFLKLLKIFWLLSPHGALAPVGSPHCIDMAVYIIGRMLQTSPTAYRELLTHNEFFAVLISSTILSDGSSNMTLATASLLQEFVLAATTMDADRRRDQDLAQLSERQSSLAITDSEAGSPEAPIESTTSSTGNDVKAFARNDRGNRSRRVSFRAVKLSSTHDGSTSVSVKISASALKFLDGLIPTQLIRLLCLLTPSAFIHVYNTSVVHTAEVIWNDEVRIQYLNRIRNLLASASFARELQIGPLSIAESKTDAESSVQVHGVYLANFLNASSKDFSAPFDVAAFVGEITKLLDAALKEFRLQELPEEPAHDGQDGDSLETGDASIESVMLFLGDYSPLKRLSLFISCVSRAFEMWRLEDDLWFDIVYPRISNCLGAAVHAIEACEGKFDTADIDEQLETMLFSIVSLCLSCKYVFENDSPSASYFMDRITTIATSNMTSRPLLSSLVLSTTIFQHQLSSGAHSYLPSFQTVCSVMSVGTSFVATLARKLELCAMDMVSKRGPDSRIRSSRIEYTQGGEGIEIAIAAAGGIPSMVEKLLFDSPQLPSLLLCCRHHVCSQSPQTATNAMGALRRYLMACAVATFASPPSSSTEPNAVADSVFMKFVGVLNSSSLHLFLIESITTVLELLHASEESNTTSNFELTANDAYGDRMLYTCAMMKSIDTIVTDSKTSLVSLVDLTSTPRESMAAVVMAREADVAGYRAVLAEAVELLRLLILASVVESSLNASTSTNSSATSVAAMVEMEGARIGSSLSALLISSCKRYFGAELTTIVGNHTFSLIDQMLTPSLLYLVLTDIPSFLTIFAAKRPSHRPLVIWNESMLAKLRVFVTTEASKIGQIELDHAEFINSSLDSKFYVSSGAPMAEGLLLKDGFRSMYPSLLDTIVVDGVHIQLLTDPKNKDDIGSRNLPKFVEELQSSLNSTKRVMDFLAKAPSEKQRRASMAGGAGARSLVSQVTVKQQVLEYVVRQHPELGFANLYVADDSTTD